MPLLPPVAKITESSWEDHQYWLQTDKKRIRRINDEHRMVYRTDRNTLQIAQLRFHYT